MAFWVYILRCSDGKFYTGHTDDLERRIGQHKTGVFSTCFTYKRRPVELAFSEYFGTRIEALEAEQRIKPWSRAKKEALIRGDWASVSYFARPPKERDSRGNDADQKGTGSSTRFVPTAVEGPSSEPGNSTSLRTNGAVGFDLCGENERKDENPLVPSEVEGRSAEPKPGPQQQ